MNKLFFFFVEQISQTIFEDFRHLSKAFDSNFLSLPFLTVTSSSSLFCLCNAMKWNIKMRINFILCRSRSHNKKDGWLPSWQQGGNQTKPVTRMVWNQGELQHNTQYDMPSSYRHYKFVPSLPDISAIEILAAASTSGEASTDPSITSLLKSSIPERHH